MCHFLRHDLVKIFPTKYEMFSFTNMICRCRDEFHFSCSCCRGCGWHGSTTKVIHSNKNIHILHSDVKQTIVYLQHVQYGSRASTAWKMSALIWLTLLFFIPILLLLGTIKHTGSWFSALLTKSTSLPRPILLSRKQLPRLCLWDHNQPTTRSLRYNTVPNHD